MLRELFAVAAGISKQEMDAMLKLNVIKIVNNLVVKPKDKNLAWLNHPECKEIFAFIPDEINKTVSLFRQDVIENVVSKLIGLEIKRPCQYNREWIAEIVQVKTPDGGMVVVSSSGSRYNIDKVKVYNTENTTCTLYNFAAELLVSDDNDEEL